MEETWTIVELAERAAGVLRADAQQVNGRVREVPGERQIRWYTTIGLVDPPLTRRGRVARYGRRHLLQLVAVKRLQAGGHSLADIQTRLTGATDTTLEAAAQLPATPAPPGQTGEPAPPPTPAPPPLPEPTPEPPSAPKPPSTAPEKSRERFWAHPNPEPGPGPGSGQGDAGSGVAARVGAGLLHGVRLAPGVALLVDGAGRTPTEEDIEAVRAAAGPLLAVLEERRLRHEGSPT